MYRNLLFFLSSKILSKKYSRKIIFRQTKWSENSFASRVWWSLIEEITLHAEEMAGEKETACCVRGYHIYKDIWAAAIWEVLVCSTKPTNVGKIFAVKLYSRKIFLYVFYVRKYFYNENKANYGMWHCFECYELWKIWRTRWQFPHFLIIQFISL